jgi:hypothetical protein
VLAGAAIRLAAAMLDKVENRLNQHQNNRHLLLAQVPKVKKVEKAVKVN